MQFVKKYAHEVALAAMTLWTCIGHEGQQGVINFFANGIGAHPKIAAVVATVGTIIARLRKP